MGTVNWWCTTTTDPWSWEWRAYPGIWLAVLALAVPYVLAVRRHRAATGDSGVTRAQRWQFGGGVVLFWLTTDWPVGTLGAGYLASVHMLQWMLYTGVVGPLLLLGTPEWMARSLVRTLRLDGVLPRLARPLVAGVVFNVVLIASHSPFAVDRLRTSSFGSMALDVVWFLAGLLVWLPIVSPLRELRASSYPVKILYLFLSMGAIPMIPGAFLTFSTYPLYGIFELAPRATSLTAVEDQTLAGIGMKIGSIPVIWPVIAVMFVRWASADRGEEPTTAVRVPTDAPAPEAVPPATVA